MAYGRAGALRRARQHRRADQQGEDAEPEADGHLGAEAHPRRRVAGEQPAEHAGQRRGGDHRAADGEQQMGPAGRAGVPPAGIAQHGHGRNRGHQAHESGQLHAGR